VSGPGVRKPPIWYAMSNIGWYAVVPPVAVGLLLPVGLLFVERAGIPALTVLYLDYAVGLLIPMLAAWWPPFVFKERIGGDGREVIYFLRRKGEGATALFLALLYWVLLVPFVLIALGTLLFTHDSIPLLLARCLFVTALAFFAAFAFQSGMIGFMLAVLVSLVVMPPAEAAIADAARVLSATWGTAALVTVVAYAVLSVALLWLGELRSRRFVC